MADHEARPPLDLDTIRRLMDPGVLIGLPLMGGWTTVSAEEI